MSHLAKDQQRGTPKSIVIFAHGYQAVPQVLSTIQVSCFVSELHKGHSHHRAPAANDG